MFRESEDWTVKKLLCQLGDLDEVYRTAHPQSREAVSCVRSGDHLCSEECCVSYHLSLYLGWQDCNEEACEEEGQIESCKTVYEPPLVYFLNLPPRPRELDPGVPPAILLL